jgi:hypothetical protein
MLGFATTIGATELQAICGVIEMTSASIAVMGSSNAPATKRARKPLAENLITVPQIRAAIALTWCRDSRMERRYGSLEPPAKGI